MARASPSPLGVTWGPRPDFMSWAHTIRALFLPPRTGTTTPVAAGCATSDHVKVFDRFASHRFPRNRHAGTCQRLPRASPFHSDSRGCRIGSVSCDPRRAATNLLNARCRTRNRFCHRFRILTPTPGVKAIDIILTQCPILNEWHRDVRAREREKRPAGCMPETPDKGGFPARLQFRSSARCLRVARRLASRPRPA